ncbi:MAG: hypothetical protein ACKVPX_16620 [Myxococcaceae bacterium]
MNDWTQAQLGACDFLDVLEEAVLLRTVRRITLVSGETFEDIVTDVVTENGQNDVVFAKHARVAALAIASISALTKAER